MAICKINPYELKLLKKMLCISMVQRRNFIKQNCIYRFIQLFPRTGFKDFKFLSARNLYSACPTELSLNSSQVYVEEVPSEIKIMKDGNFVLEGEYASNLPQHEFECMSQKFGLEKLKPMYLEKYKVKISSDGNRLFFPMDGIDKSTIAVRILNYNANLGELNESIFPSGVTSAVFGWFPNSRKTDDIIVMNSCLDVIAANQELQIPAVAVHFEDGTFPLETLKLFEPFQKIYFWFSEHLHSCALHMKFAKKFGKKAFVISPHDNPSTALTYFQTGKSLKAILRKAVTLKPEDIVMFSDRKDGVRAEFEEYDEFCGIKWKRFDVLNELLKGLRKGELTVFSGQSGVGKTTFMSEYSLDLCLQGVPTLWGSFEVKNTRLMKTMITQFSRCNLIKEPIDKFNYWFSEFEKLGMFFMEFNTHQSTERIISAMSNLVRAYGIGHVVIDNLQFMLYNVLSSEYSGATADVYFKQDQLFSMFRSFAHQHNCHVTLVIHPRKEPELSELNITSISGTARATQEADNVLLLQTTQSRQYLQVKKNRFAGTRGCVIVEFDEETLTYSIKKIPSKQMITHPKR